MFGLPDEFTPGFLARLEKLRIRTRQRYAGLGRGMHLSPKRGSSLEFNDYRHYSPPTTSATSTGDSTGAATNSTSSYSRKRKTC